MKKKIALILVLCVIATVLCSCSTSYEEAETSNTYPLSKGYFTVIKQWNGGIDWPIESIVYANDTGVMYYIFLKGHCLKTWGKRGDTCLGTLLPCAQKHWNGRCIHQLCWC